MTTRRQIEANRENAAKSTGPRTVGGLERSSRNSRRHGLTAKALVMEGEDPAELQELIDTYFETYAPEGPVEEKLTNDLAISHWKMMRAERKEAEEGFEGTVYRMEREGRYGGATTERVEWSGFNTIVRYRMAAERSWYRALTSLTELRKARGRPVEVSPLAALPALEKIKDPEILLSAVLAAVREGTVPINDALKIARLVETYGKSVDRNITGERIRALEELVSTIKWQLPNRDA